MAAINDLIAQIEDIALRERIAKEVDRLSKQKKFGLVFEEHLPECTPLYEYPCEGWRACKRRRPVRSMMFIKFFVLRTIRHSACIENPRKLRRLPLTTL